MKIEVNRSEVFKWAGYLGVTLLVAGLVRYEVQEMMGTFNLSLLIAGGVLTIVGIVANYRGIGAVVGRRSTRLGANSAVISLAVIAIIGIFNFLGYRHHKRIDMSADQLYSLSDQTRKIVSGLAKDVKVLKFDQKDDSQLHDLVREYRDLSSHISYELVDPQAKPGLAKQYKITSMGELLVACGDRTERPTATDEQALTSAIIKVTSDSVKKIYFVQGHGEKQISDLNRGEGYGLVDRELKNENYGTQAVNLVETNQVPADCDVLVVAGPKQSLFPQEATMIGKYLDGGGKAMFLLDPEMDPKLQDVLKQWGIELGDDIVVDVSGVGRLFGAGPTIPLARSYGTHEITKGFEGSMTYFPLARSVSIMREARGSASTTELVKTSEQSFGTTEIKGNEIQINPAKDKKGPITLGVASTRSIGDKQSRLVVFGDSDFAENQNYREQRNGDLFLNSVNWLAEDESLISIRPKNPTERRVVMTASQQNMLFMLTIIFMPAAVIGSGVYIWWKRR